MKTVKHQYYPFGGFVHSIGTHGYEYEFISDDLIEDGKYFLVLTSGIIDFPAQVKIEAVYDNWYLVSAYIEDELDELQFEVQMDYLKSCIHFNFGLESFDGEFYAPEEYS